MERISIQEIRELVRAAIAAELPTLKRAAPGSASQETPVVITSDDDLNAFARQMLEIAADPQRRQQFESGLLRFKLAAPRSAASSRPQQSAAARIDAKLITERTIQALPAGTTRLQIAKHARLTPLARDRLRQLKITVERFE